MATLSALAGGDHAPPHERVTAAKTPEKVYFVLQRQNGHWSVGAQIIHVFNALADAELQALAEKKKHPGLHFGVCTLTSEVREALNPYRVVQV